MTYHFDWLREFPYWTFDDAISTAVDEFPGAWKDFWGIGLASCPPDIEVEDWEVANEMHDLGRRICNAASKLQSKGLPKQLRTLPPVIMAEAAAERASRRELADRLEHVATPEQLAQKPFRDLVNFFRWSEGQAEAKAKLFQTAVEIYTFRGFGLTPRALAARLQSLLEFLVRTRGERTREYLARVATCYVRGMGPELAVMSRAVMESALQIDAVDQRMVSNVNIQGDRKPHPGLADWIQAAVDVGALDEGGRKSAKFVKDAGDDAIHNVPQQTPDADAILKNLREVLSQLERFDGKRP